MPSIQSRCLALAQSIAREESYLHNLPIDQFNRKVAALASHIENAIDDFLNDAYDETINPTYPTEDDH